MGYLTAQEKTELLADIEKTIDAAKARRFFKYHYRNHQIKDLDIPQFNMLKTSANLISVGYATSSAPVLSSQSSNNSSLKEWSKVFGDDGRLRFSQILSLFPSSDDLTKLEYAIYEQTLVHAHFALSSYQKEHGAEFELVAPVVSYVFLCYEPVIDLAYVNFFAKPKNSDSAPDLFFAEMVACGNRCNEVIKCCIMAPRPSPVAMTFEGVKVWLPPDEADRRPVGHDSIYCDSD